MNPEPTRPERDLRTCWLFCEEPTDLTRGNQPTLEPGDALCDGVVGNEEDILPLTAWVPSELERIGYFADYYMERARDLVRCSLNSALGAENYFYVVGFLYRHAIELYLKSIIASTLNFQRQPEPEQARLIYGHDLEKLWNRARPIAQRLVDGEYLKLADGPLLELSALDKASDAFRYPFTVENKKTGKRNSLLAGLEQISFHNFVWVMEGLCDWFKGLENARGLCGGEVLNDRERLLKRWREIIDHVRGQLSDLLWQREQIRRIGKMIDANPRLRASGKPFLWDARRWYMFFAVMRVRSQADKDEDVYSLRRVLEEIREHPQLFSRDYALELVQNDGHYKGSDFEQSLTDSIWKQFRNDSGDFDTDALDADIRHLEDISRDVRKLANKSIAHVTKQGVLNEPKLTFNDLDKCIDAFESITMKYITLLTGGGYATLLPTEQFDWYEEFAFAWKPRDDMETHRDITAVARPVAGNG